MLYFACECFEKMSVFHRRTPLLSLVILKSINWEPKIYTVIILSAKMWTVKGFFCLIFYAPSLDALFKGFLSRIHFSNVSLWIRCWMYIFENLIGFRKVIHTLCGYLGMFSNKWKLKHWKTSVLNGSTFFKNSVTTRLNVSWHNYLLKNLTSGFTEKSFFFFFFPGIYW